MLYPKNIVRMIEYCAEHKAGGVLNWAFNIRCHFASVVEKEFLKGLHSSDRHLS